MENKCDGMCENCTMGDECGHNDCETEPNFMDIIFKSVGIMALGVIFMGIFLASC